MLTDIGSILEKNTREKRQNDAEKGIKKHLLNNSEAVFTNY